MNQNETITSYQYNADDSRTQKKSGNVTTDYFLNGSQILMQQTKDGDSVTETLWFFYDNQGNRVDLCREGAYFYYLYNVQGDVLALVDAETGKIAANYQYGAWGEKTSVKTAEGYGDLGTANPFRYRGYYWDEESGLYYLNSRYYSPELCRFISADSQINGDVLGTNLFAYCGNNPVNRADYEGHAYGALIGGVLGGIFGGISAAINGESIGAGIFTGMCTGALIGGICDGTTLVASAVVGAMAKCALVAAGGNVANQFFNYKEEKDRFYENLDNSTCATTTSVGNGVSGYMSFAEYYVLEDTLASATLTATFVPLSIAGSTLSATAFKGVEMTSANQVGKFLLDTAMEGELNSLQFAIELIISGI